MTNNEKRTLEIQFFLICWDLTKLTFPPNQLNINNFIDFLEKIDFTKSLDCAIIKVLAETVFTENTNLQPNKTELCNFCYTNNVHYKKVTKYARISKEMYDTFISQIKAEPYFQPTHLQDHVYIQIKAFLNLINKVTNLGVKL